MGFVEMSEYLPVLMSFGKRTIGSGKTRNDDRQEELKFIPFIVRGNAGDIFINKLIDSHLVRRFREKRGLRSVDT